MSADKVNEILNQALASELVSWSTYLAQSTAASGLRADAVSREFAEHAAQEREHAMALIARIDEIGGTPILDPSEYPALSIHEFSGAAPLMEMIEYQLEAERKAVDFYRQAIQWIGDRDPTTRRVLEDILAVEERHANDLDGLSEATR